MISDPYFQSAVLTGLGVSVAMAPLGCFVLWRRMAYFSDTTAHASILGVALALFLGISITLGILAVTLFVGLAVILGTSRTRGSDTLLGVAAHGGLALGLVAASFVSGGQVNLDRFLFGDVLTVSGANTATIWAAAALACLLVWWRRHRWLLATVNPDLAMAAGIHSRRENVIMMIALAIIVALSIQVVGALLAGAMLIIPAAAARPFSKTPEQMILGALAAGFLSVMGGTTVSFLIDTPTGPTVVSVALVIFVLMTFTKGVFAR